LFWDKFVLIDKVSAAQIDAVACNVHLSTTEGPMPVMKLSP
jgi:hypothetical protein